MKFKIGDIVLCKERFSVYPGFLSDMGEWLNKPMTIKFITEDLKAVKVKENIHWWPLSKLTPHFVGIEMETGLTLKIKYLYVRQKWVKEGKKEASYYTEQVV